MWPDPAKLQNKVAYYVKNYNSTFLQAVQGPWVWAFFWLSIAERENQRCDHQNSNYGPPS